MAAPAPPADAADTARAAVKATHKFTPTQAEDFKTVFDEADEARRDVEGSQTTVGVQVSFPRAALDAATYLRYARHSAPRGYYAHRVYMRIVLRCSAWPPAL